MIVAELKSSMNSLIMMEAWCNAFPYELAVDCR